MSLFSYKNVFQIILRKGGKSVFIETFGIFRCRVNRNFDLNELSCSRSRQSTQGGYLGIKHRGASFNLLVDREGEFYDPILFDMTAGMFRDLRQQPKK